MLPASARRDRKTLDRELASPEFQSLLESLRSSCPEVEDFSHWNEVLEFMHRGSSTGERKNAVLLALFEQRDLNGDPRWHNVLLAMFWPGLESLSRSRGYWDLDRNTLWTNAYWAFLQTVIKIDVTQRRDRLAQKIHNDTFHRLHAIYEKKWARQEREVSLQPSEPAGSSEADAGLWEPGEMDLGLAEVDLDLRNEGQIRRYRSHLEKGRITETDLLLLVGTRVYGYTLRDWARHTGMAYEAAKKRRLRVEALLKRVEKRWNP